MTQSECVLLACFWFAADCVLGMYVGKVLKARRSDFCRVLPFRRER